VKTTLINRLNLWALGKGLLTTITQFFGTRAGPKLVTVTYPERRLRLHERFRGLHRLERYGDGPNKGLEKCVGCALCAAACPADVITVVAGENDPEDPHSPAERYAEVYDMDILRCIFCGMCVEACPTGAIVMKHDFELADDARGGPQGGPDKFIYHKEDLLEREFHW